jgi:hypothetical protein
MGLSFFQGLASHSNQCFSQFAFLLESYLFLSPPSPVGLLNVCNEMITFSMLSRWAQLSYITSSPLITFSMLSSPCFVGMGALKKVKV